MMNYQIIYWRDIPVQIRTRNDRTRNAHLLSPRFQKAVHRAAFRARAINGLDYMEEWRTSAWQEQNTSAENNFLTIVTELENAYSDDRLNKLAHNKGFELHDD